MRFAALFASGLALALNACASKQPAVSTSPLAACPFNVLATVRNPTNNKWDVYYQDGKTRTLLGEIAAGSTQTYTLPGEGRGYVSLRGGSGPTAGRARTDRVGGAQVRTHCAGS
jgi:hypothetical protein